MKEMVTLNKKEQRRLVVLNQVDRGEMIGRQVAEVLDLSLRQMRRLLAAYRKEGAAALAHGNRGRKPHHALNEGQRKQVLALAQSTFAVMYSPGFTSRFPDALAKTFSAIVIPMPVSPFLFIPLH